MALLRNIGKLFGRMGDDVASALKNLWRGGPKLGKALEHKALEDIPDAVHKAKLFRGKIADDIARKVKSGHEGIYKEIQTRSAHIQRASDEFGRANRALVKTEKSLNDARRNRDYHRMRGNEERYYEQHQLAESLERDLLRQREHVGGLKGMLDDKIMNKQVLENFYSAAKSSPQSAIKNIKANPQLQGEFTSLGRYVDEIEDALVTKNQIINSASKNLSSDYRFAKEYLNHIHPSLDKSSSYGVYANNWMANPKNMTKLEELRVNKKFQRFLDIDVGGKAARESLRGLGRRELAAKLGLPVATIALTAGPLAVMSWLDSESDEVAAESGQTAANLKGFVASGPGAPIQKRALQAVANIQAALIDADAEISKNPVAAINIVNTIVKNKAIIDESLSKWETVIDSADNADTAKTVGQELQKYSKDIEKRLGNITQIVGQHAGMEPGRAGNIVRPKLTSDRIKGIQSYLANKFPEVAPTGKLDRPTIQALRMLERKFDTLGETGRFTSTRLLVRPREGHLIELQDLQKLEKMLQKGR